MEVNHLQKLSRAVSFVYFFESFVLGFVFLAHGAYSLVLALEERELLLEDLVLAGVVVIHLHV